MLFYGSFCMQAFDYPLFCGTFCSQVAECMHIYVVRTLPYPLILISLSFSFTFPLLLAWPDRNMPSAGGGVAAVLDSFFVAFIASAY